MSRRKIDEVAQERVQDETGELFSVLGNQTRIAILFALAGAERDVGRPVPFSEIYRRIEMRDSSKFNYHLKALTGTYVERMEDGYQLRYVGRLIYRAIKSGEFIPEQALEPTEIDSLCYKCGSKLIAGYEDGRLLIRCDACEDISYRITIPPMTLLERTPDEFLAAADKQIRSDIALAAHGVCPHCSGKMIPSVRDPSDVPTDNIYINHDCIQCGQLIISTTVGELLLSNPAVISFCFERDYNLFSRPCWEISFCVSDEDHIALLSEDPWRIQFELRLDRDVLRIVLDDELEPVETSIATDDSF